jgi:hypothetical protein
MTTYINYTPKSKKQTCIHETHSKNNSHMPNASPPIPSPSLLLKKGLHLTDMSTQHFFLWGIFTMLQKKGSCDTVNVYCEKVPKLSPDF